MSLWGQGPIKPREFMVLLLSWSFQHVAWNIWSDHWRLTPSKSPPLFLCLVNESHKAKLEAKLERTQRIFWLPICSIFELSLSLSLSLSIYLSLSLGNKRWAPNPQRKGKNKGKPPKGGYPIPIGSEKAKGNNNLKVHSHLVLRTLVLSPLTHDTSHLQLKLYLLWRFYVKLTFILTLSYCPFNIGCHLYFHLTLI
jgi:hypothetical protein